MTFVMGTVLLRFLFDEASMTGWRALRSLVKSRLTSCSRGRFDEGDEPARRTACGEGWTGAAKAAGRRASGRSAERAGMVAGRCAARKASVGRKGEKLKRRRAL